MSYNKPHDNNDHDRGVKMTLTKKLKEFFQKNDAARPPPDLKKRDLFKSAIITLKREKIKMNNPPKHQNRNFKNPPHFFESTLSPPESEKEVFFYRHPYSIKFSSTPFN